MVINPVYKGTAVYGKTSGSGHLNRKTTKLKRKDKKDWIMVENAYPRIVTLDDWDIINDALSKRALVPKRARAEETALSGLMKCALCGSTLTVQKKKDAKETWSPTVRNCKHRYPETNKLCENRGIAVDTILLNIWESIREYKGELLSYLKESQGSDKEVDSIINEIEKLTADIERYGDALERVRDGYDEGIYNKDEFITRQKNGMTE